eukprot:2539643-Pyramimonas_sp.AAC.1
MQSRANGVQLVVGPVRLPDRVRSQPLRDGVAAWWSRAYDPQAGLPTSAAEQWQLANGSSFTSSIGFSGSAAGRGRILFRRHARA